MMYESKLAAAIKVAGKVLREHDKDKVYLPFGSEYSIFLKNKNSVRAVAHVLIDGKDVGDGRGFVVPAFGEIDIERFINNGNLDKGNRFKFIERTGKIEQHRGVGVEDGLIEVRFQYEKVAPVIKHYWYDNQYCNDVYGGVDHLIGSPLRNRGSSEPYFGSGTTTTCSTKSLASNSADNITLDSFDLSPQNETGITAPGSLSDQSFNDAGYIPLEYEKHSMVFHLLGETEDNRSVREAVTVKHKPRCTMCDTINRYDAKFCSECGTALQIV